MEETEPTDNDETNDTVSDDALRRLAAAKLAQHLDMGGALVARCQDLARVARGDRLGPLSAAARLMRANAHVAQTLAHVALVERRSRTIVEQVQRPAPETGELNSQKRSRSEEAEHRLKYWRRMNEHVENSIKIRSGQMEGQDRFHMLIRLAEEELARIEREEGGY